jgi:pullulanase
MPVASAPNRDLTELVRTCHVHRVRFFVDVVMAFSKNHPYLAAVCDEFFILDPSKAKSDPDAHNSRGSDDNNLRNGFGASLFRYGKRSRATIPSPAKGRTSPPPGSS